MLQSYNSNKNLSTRTWKQANLSKLLPAKYVENCQTVSLSLPKSMVEATCLLQVNKTRLLLLKTHSTGARENLLKQQLKQPKLCLIQMSLISFHLCYQFRIMFWPIMHRLWRVDWKTQTFLVLYRKNCIQSIQCCISRRSKTAKIKCYKL